MMNYSIVYLLTYNIFILIEIDNKLKRFFKESFFTIYIINVQSLKTIGQNKRFVCIL